MEIGNNHQLKELAMEIDFMLMVIVFCKLPIFVMLPMYCIFVIIIQSNLTNKMQERDIFENYGNDNHAKSCGCRTIFNCTKHMKRT